MEENIETKNYIARLPLSDSEKEVLMLLLAERKSVIDAAVKTLVDEVACQIAIGLERAFANMPLTGAAVKTEAMP